MLKNGFAVGRSRPNEFTARGRSSPMPDNVEYNIYEVPLLGRNLAASRIPRLQPTVPEEYGGMLSDEVSRGAWTVDPQNGEPLSAKGMTIAQHLEFMLNTRAHWLMPTVLQDEADGAWVGPGNITARGKRFEQIK